MFFTFVNELSIGKTLQLCCYALHSFTISFERVLFPLMTFDAETLLLYLYIKRVEKFRTSSTRTAFMISQN